MTASSPIPCRVRLLMPVLGSEHDGEVVGAARAVSRTLRAAGLDLHDLAAAIPVEGDPSRHGARAEAERPFPRATGPRSYGDWRQAWGRQHRRRCFTEKQEAEQRRQMDFCRRHSDRLAPREWSFIQDIARRNDGLSYAQGGWLADIAERLHFEGRRQWQ